MKLIIPTDQKQLERIFGCEDEENDVSPAGDLKPGMFERLGELARWVPSEATLTLARDWEGCLCALLEGSPWGDVLAFTDNGAIGHGGVNQPRYFETVIELREDDNERRQTHVHENDEATVKLALRFLASAVGSGYVGDGPSDDAADLYRRKYGEDYGDDTFSAGALREGALVI